MSKVKEIYESLWEKHRSKFKAEQLWAWANMIQLDKHSLLETPPAGHLSSQWSELVYSYSDKGSYLLIS